MTVAASWAPSDPCTLDSYDAVALTCATSAATRNRWTSRRRVVRGVRAAGGRENPDWLNARKGFAAALRKAGHHWDALQESEDVVQRYRDYLGPDHTYTLRAATNLINDRRAVGDLVRCRGTGPGGPTNGARRPASRRSRLRRAGQPGVSAARGGAARRRHAGTTCRPGTGSSDVYGDRHPFTLAAGINYASDLAACGGLGDGDPARSGDAGQLPRALATTIPDTLMAAANLAIDEAASGNQARGGRLPRRRAAPVRADADHGTSRGPGGRAGDPPHRGDRAILTCKPADPAPTISDRSLTRGRARG